MAWKMIRQTGSLCLMMVFLATSAMAVDQAFRDEVAAAFVSIDQPGLAAEIQSNVPERTDGQVWELYVSQFGPDIDPNATTCVASAGASVSCNNGS